MEGFRIAGVLQATPIDSYGGGPFQKFKIPPPPTLIQHKYYNVVLTLTTKINGMHLLRIFSYVDLLSKSPPGSTSPAIFETII